MPGFHQWFFSFGWLIPTAIGVWFLLTQLGLGIIEMIRRRRSAAGRETRFLWIKIDAARFVVVWGLLLALLIVEAYLLLDTFNYFYDVPEKRHKYILARIQDLKNIGIAIISLLTLHRLSRVITEGILSRVSRNGDAQENRERQQRIRTLVGVLQGIITTVLAVAGIVLVIWQIDPSRSLAKLLAASAGVVGIIIAFGTQSLMRDFFAGFFILMENQYKIGDVVRIGDRSGRVEHISLRVTTLRDDQGTLHLIPNGEVKVVSNSSSGWALAPADITLNLAYDPEHVVGVLARVAHELAADRAYSNSILGEPEVAGIESLSSAGGATYRVLFKTVPAAQGLVTREFRKRAFNALAAEQVLVLPAPPTK
jgi:moderate conductance mechanosensitive channel